jgi:hypothetical protein
MRARGRVPLVVGGTGLYIRGIVDDLTIPHVPPQPDLRVQLEAEEHAHGPGYLHTRLAVLDPVLLHEFLELPGVALHDLGKLGLPDEILGKPGPLTQDERRTMERHTVLGARLLGSVRDPLTDLAASIALSHHERWDGDGYPFAIAGDRIPLAARIVAVVDVLDALVHERPYRTAWPIDRAIEELRRLGGSQLDPDLVRAFIGDDVATVPTAVPETDPIQVIIDADATAGVSR